MTSFYENADFDLAKRLQEEYDKEAAEDLENTGVKTTASGFTKKTPSYNLSPVDPSLEFSDPNPEIRELFLQFNTQFFWNMLNGIEVKWSPRMTLCAGLCVYEGRGGLCSVRLSLPLLKLRPRKDLVETLLHEMIHAYLFITDDNRDHDGHGPQFQSHMNRINDATGANISIYHNFHDEVENYKTHWWRCDGPCQKWPPYFGMVKRAMNRAPSPRDPWWGRHAAKCGGSFSKVKEPEGYKKKKQKSAMGENPDRKKGLEKTADSDVNPALQDIRTFMGKGHILGTANGSSSVRGSSSLFSVLGSNNRTDSKPSTSNNSNTSSPTVSPLKSPITDVQNESNGFDDDDDDSWVFDVDEFSEDLPSSTKPSTSKTSEDYVPFVDMTLNDYPLPGKKDQTKKDKGKKNKPRLKRSVSVCSDPNDKSSNNFNFKNKKPKKRKEYIFDELDDDEGLWDEGYSPSPGENRKVIDKKNLLTSGRTSLTGKHLVHDHNNNTKSGITKISSNNGIKTSPVNKSLNKSDKKSIFTSVSPSSSTSRIPSNSSSNSTSSSSSRSSSSSTSNSGYTLGSAVGGLSYLAKMRKMLENQQNNCSSLINRNNSVKRKSDDFHRDNNVVSSAKRPCVVEDTPAQVSVRQEDSPSSVDCPCCGTKVLPSLINEHLDNCLS